MDQALSSHNTSETCYLASLQSQGRGSGAELALESPGSLLKPRWLDSARPPYPQVEIPGSAGLEWGSRICIPNKLPGKADAAGRGTHFENHQIKVYNIALEH